MKPHPPALRDSCCSGDDDGSGCTCKPAKTVHMFSFSAGEFWDEEAHYIREGLEKLYGKDEAKRIMKDEIEERKVPGKLHAFEIWCTESAFAKIIKAAFALPAPNYLSEPEINQGQES